MITSHELGGIPGRPSGAGVSLGVIVGEAVEVGVDDGVKEGY